MKFGEKLKSGLEIACHWLVDVAQVKTKVLTCEKNKYCFNYPDWSGAIRGEYSVARREWDFFGPVWHGGQAVKALVMAYRVTAETSFLEGARNAAEFIVRYQLTDKDPKVDGLILGYEGCADKVVISAILEAMDGLIYFAEETGEEKWWINVRRALEWVARNAHIKGEGLFYDAFNPLTKRIIPRPYSQFHYQGRPLLDDGLFLKGYQKFGEKLWRDIFYETADRLLKDEYPPGNWINYGPCNPETGSIHPRHAYWWGRPMLMAYKDSRHEKYLKQNIRSADWYMDAQRQDGGIIRGTFINKKTDSFGHATSGAACAVIMWAELWQELKKMRKYLPAIRRGLDYCLSLQFWNPKDKKLKGCILEKVLPPDGTDSSPYYIRDMGTIFFIQAAGLILKDKSLLEELESL